MYGIADYGAMIADNVRMDAFVGGLRRAIRPGSVVVDLGTGVGIFALIACRLGARRVYAIEPGDAIEVARELAAANGCADRIEFIHAMSTDVTLPERVDVIVSDISGCVPWFQRLIPSIADARRRFLLPGGALIPQRDDVWAAVVEAPDMYARRTAPWGGNAFGLDMQAARWIAVNTLGSGFFEGAQMLAGPQVWRTIDYGVVDEPDVRDTLTWTITRAGAAHGFVIGFDRTVAEGVGFSNAPDTPAGVRSQSVYPASFFPWPAPVTVGVGDRVTVDLAAVLAHDEYIWKWDTRILAHDGTGGEKSFVQSTFFGLPLSASRLPLSKAGYAPTLNENGRIAALVLESMSAGLTLGETAERLRANFAVRFSRFEDALSYACGFSRQYAR